MRLVEIVSPSPGELLLDVGCGNRPYQWMIPQAHWIGLNPEAHGAEPDLIGDALALPFKDATLDGVLATQVLEHVRRPWVALEEVFRCLKPGGWCIATIPMAWRLHEEPWDFWRFTRYGFAGIAEDCGFEVIEISEDLPTVPSILNSIQHLFTGRIFAPVRLSINLLGLATWPISRSSHYSTNLSCLLRRPT
jgi:SAM-dependent methyltransferase